MVKIDRIYHWIIVNKIFINYKTVDGDNYLLVLNTLAKFLEQVIVDFYICHIVLTTNL